MSNNQKNIETHLGRGKLLFAKFLYEIDTAVNPHIKIKDTWQPDRAEGLNKEHFELSDNEIERLIDRYDNGDILIFSFPIDLGKKKKLDGTSTPQIKSKFTIAVQKSQTILSANTQERKIYRNGLDIKKEKCLERFSCSGAFYVMDITESAINEYVADSEVKNHENFNASKPEFKAKWNPSALSDLRASMNNLFVFLSRQQIKRRDDIALDIIGVLLPKRPKPKEPTNPIHTQTTPTPPPPPRASRYIYLDKKANSLKLIRGDIDIPQHLLPYNVIVQMAYATGKGDSIKKYRSADFDLSDQQQFTYKEKNAAKSILSSNKIEYTIKHEDFEIEIQGFDKVLNVWMTTK